MAVDMVKVEINKRKSAFGRVFEKGSIVLVKVDQHGQARIITAPSIVLAPSEYKMHIPDDEYDKLLNQQHGDVV